MKILIVSYYFHPAVSAHSYRWSQIAKEWKKKGHTIEVISGKHGLSSSRDFFDISVKQIGIKRGWGNSNRKVEQSKIEAGRKRIKDKLKIMYRKLFWPDGLWHWLPFLAFELVKRRGENYDIIVTYSPTFTAHLGGYLFKKISGNDFKWIADYGDPFSLSDTMQPNNFFIYGRLNAAAEKKVLSASSLVSFTNKQTYDSYSCSFPDVKDNAKIIPHIVDIDMFYCGNFIQKKSHDKVALVYVGAFHKGIREPYMLLKYFSEIHRAMKGKVELHIYGPDNGVMRNFDIVEGVFLHGLIGREEAILEMKKADLLINVENENCMMTPSKVVEYLATGLPVINFHKRQISDLLSKKIKRVYNCSCETEVNEIVGFIEQYAGKVEDYEETFALLQEYAVESVSVRYLRHA